MKALDHIGMKQNIIMIMHDMGVYHPPARKLTWSAKTHAKKVSEYVKMVDKYADRLELIAEIYDENFLRIRASVKGNREHIKLLIVEDILNYESIWLRKRLGIYPRTADEKEKVGSASGGIGSAQGRRGVKIPPSQCGKTRESNRSQMEAQD